MPRLSQRIQRSPFLGVALLALSNSPRAGGGEDTSPHTPYPSPRASGAGSVPFTASNVLLLGWKTLADFAGSNASGSDCWGYTSPSGREYALIGMSNGTGFVEVTDPGAPQVVAFHGGVSSLWRAVKTYSTYAYAVSEGGGGIQVFDLADIDDGVVTLTTTVLSGGCTTATHTLAIDEVSGFLYRAGGGGEPCGSGPQGIVAYSLADPANPSLAGGWHTRYVHECQVVTWDVAGPYFGRQIAFCYADESSGGGNPRLRILDVTDKSSITQISVTAYAGGEFAHQGWISASKEHLYLNDELDDLSFGGARTRIFDIGDLAAPTYLGFFSSGAASVDHNLYVKGERIYEANYRSGLRVFDNTTPTAPTQIGFFDTYPEDDLPQFNSLWSNYPFFESGTVIGSDVEKGLFVWRLGSPKLLFAFPSGVPIALDPSGATLQFEVSEATFGALQAGSVELAYGTGGVFTSVPATPLGGVLYQASIPAQACGAKVDFYLSARSTDGVTWTDPPAGPTQVHIARAALSQSIGLEDTLETVTGWIVDGVGDTAATGIWTRVDPLGTSAQPEDDHSSPGSLCFVTGQGSLGGPLSEADVDFGVTTLRTPVFDATGYGNPHLSYWRWFSNHHRIYAIDDPFLVDISNDGGTSWVALEVIVPGDLDALGGWIQHEARIADFVMPTSNMQLRFRALDLLGHSIVEAAIDDLRIVDYDCGPVTLASLVPATGPFDGGNVVTLTGTGFQAGVTSVTFGSNVAAVVDVVNSTTIHVRVPRALGPVGPGLNGGHTGLAGKKVDVRVQNPGVDTLVKAYTYSLGMKTF